MSIYFFLIVILSAIFTKIAVFPLIYKAQLNTGVQLLISVLFILLLTLDNQIIKKNRFVQIVFGIGSILFTSFAVYNFELGESTVSLFFVSMLFLNFLKAFFVSKSDIQISSV